MNNWVNGINIDDKQLDKFKHLTKKEIQKIVAEKFEYFSSLIKYSKNSWLTMKPYQLRPWEQEWTFACWLWEEGDAFFNKYVQGKIKFEDIPEEYFEPKYLYYWLPWLLSKDNEVLWPIVDHELEHAESSDYWDILVNTREAVEHNFPVTTVWMFFNAFEDIYMGKKQIAKWRAKRLGVQNLYKDMFITTGTKDIRWKLLKLDQFAEKSLHYWLSKEFPLTFDTKIIVDEDVQEEFDKFVEHLDEIVDVTIDNKERIKKKNDILWPIIERLWTRDMDRMQRERIKEQIKQERKEQQQQQIQQTQENTQGELNDALNQQEWNNWEQQEGVKQIQEWTQEELKDTLNDNDWKDSWENNSNNQWEWESESEQDSSWENSEGQWTEWQKNQWSNWWESSENKGQEWGDQNNDSNSWEEENKQENQWAWWNMPGMEWEKGNKNKSQSSEWNNQWNSTDSWEQWWEQETQQEWNQGWDSKMKSNWGMWNNQEAQWTNFQQNNTQWSSNNEWMPWWESRWESQWEESNQQQWNPQHNSWRSHSSQSPQSSQWWEQQDMESNSEWLWISDSELESEIEKRLQSMSDDEKKQMMEEIKDAIDKENLKGHWEDLKMQKKLLENKEDWKESKEWEGNEEPNPKDERKKEMEERKQQKEVEEMQKQWENIEKAVEERQADLDHEKELGEYLDKLEEMTHEKDLDKMDAVEKEYENLKEKAENIESEDVKQRLKEKIEAMSQYLKKKEKDYEKELAKSWFSRDEEYLYRRYMKLEKELSKDVDRFIKKLEAEIPKLKEYKLEGWYNSWRVTDMNEAWRKIRLKQRWEKLYSRFEEKESLEVNLWICLSVDVSWSMRGSIWDTMKLVIFLWLLCQKWWIPFHVNTFGENLNIIKDTDDEFEERKWKLMREMVANDWWTNISLSVQKDLDVIKEVEDTHPNTVFLPIFITDWEANEGILWDSLIELMNWFKWLSTMVGIGIDERHLKQWYPNSKVIWLNSASEIMTVLLRELRQFFKKHKSQIFKVVTE